ncbi:MAG: hypothetical protein OXG38_11290 [Chloroflexi bacterium]|nr:hypothetical protein [Chloroflexota bacterium]
MADFNTAYEMQRSLDDFVTRAEFHQALHAMEIRLGGLAVALTGIALAIAKLT